MIEGFGNKVARDVWETNFSKQMPRDLLLRAKALLTIMHSVSNFADLKRLGQPPHLRLHKLKGGRKDEWSITIDLPWCITFEYRDGKFFHVKIENYHRG